MRIHPAMQMAAFVVLFTACSSQPTAPDPVVDKDPLAIATAELLAAHRDYLAGDRSTQQVDQIVKLAETRFALANSLLPAEPDRVRKYALSRAVIASMPDSALKHVERYSTLRGKLAEVYADAINGSHRLELTIRTATRRWDVLATKAVDEKRLKNGSVATLDGVAFGYTLLIDNADVQGVPFELETPTGAQEVLVLLVNFTDNTSQPYSKATAEARLFGTGSGQVNAFYKEMSNDITWFTGTVHDWMTMDIASTCNANNIEAAALAKAAEQGIDVSGFRRLIIGFPGSCSYAGKGTVGGDPSTSWIAGNYFNLRVVSHELGHNHGLYHTHSLLNCTADPPTEANCTYSNYGHYWDVLGFSGIVGHFAPRQKERLGWLGSEGYDGIIDVSASGTHTIGVYAATGGGDKVLKIAGTKDGGDLSYYYVSYRKTVNFDSSPFEGVVITKGVHDSGSGAGNQIYMLDATPATTTFGDVELPVGSTWTDSVSGISITTDAATSSSATISVAITPPTGTCTRAAPSIAQLSNANPSLALSAGDDGYYELTVQNNDSNCSASSFDITTNGLPAGWSVVHAPQSLLIPAGEQATTLIRITSSASASPGNYPYTITVDDPSVAGHSVTSPTANVTISDCVRADPTLSISPATKQGPAGTSTTYTLTVTNNDSSGCETSYLLTGQDGGPSGVYGPDGWGLSFSGGWISPGATKTYTFSVTVPSGEPDGIYTVGALYEAYPSGRTMFATATYEIVPCVRATPTVAVTPSSQSGSPGATLSYDVDVTNNDSAGCLDQTFNASPTVPSGWTGALASSSSSVAPGATWSTTVDVTSPTSGVTATSYPLSVSATGTDSGTDSGSASYVVTCDRAAPTVSISPASQTGGPSQLRSYTVTVANNDGPACAAGTFNLASSLPSGWTGGTTTSSVTVAAGGSGTTTLNLTAPASVMQGTYSGSVTASNAASGSDSGSANYVVGCTPAVPTVSLSPSSQTGGPGQTKTYTVSVTNNNESTCLAATFNLGASLPSGFSGGTGVSSLTLASGATGTTSLSATAPSSVSAGSHTVSASASNAASGTGSGAATYVVTCTRSAPTVSISPASQTGGPSETKSYTVTVTNNDESTCASGTFALATTVPSGWTGGTTGSSVTLSPGASTTTTLNVTAPASVSESSYTASVQASNGDSGSGSDSATYTVTCTRAAPSVSISPASQSGGRSESKIYTVSVTSNDQSTCSASTMTLAASLPSGFSGGLSVGSLSVAPGATQTTTLTVTSSASAVEGTYTSSVTATNGASGSGSDTADYVVACAPAAPTVSLSPSSQTGGPGQTKTYTATITNNNQNTCNSATFTLTGSLPSGWTGGPAQGSVTLTSGASTTTSLTVTAPASVSAGTYSPSITAANAESGSASASANYVVNCTRAAPTVAISPASQAGGPNQTKTYTVTVTNNDESTCADGTFSMGATVPSGWTGNTSAASLTIAPGASATTSLNVTAPSGVTEGDYTASASASNASSGSASANATYQVICNRDAPSVSISPASQIGARGQSKTYTVSVTSNDTTVCSSTTMTLAAALPAGWSGGLSDASLSIAPGATATTTLTVTASSSAMEGTYPTQVTASNGAAGDGMDSADYVIECTRAAPTIAFSPSSQTGAPGQALAYNVTVTNNDGATCYDGTFSLSTTPASGWSATASPATVTVAAGASASATVTVTSPSSALEGTTDTGVMASNAASGSANGTVQYAIVCVPAAPSVSVSPSSQTGAPGTAKTYTATVTNNDVGCVASAIAVGASAPTGWTASTVDSSLTLASGTSQSTTLSVTSPAGSSGSHTATVTATHPTAGSGSANATYLVQCSRNKPTVSITPASQSAAAGAQLDYTVSVTNNDVGCASDPFAMTISAPSGWTSSVDDQNLTVNPGETQTTTLHVTSPAGAQPGTFTASVSADNGASEVAQADANYLVAPPQCVAGTPALTVQPSKLAGLEGSALTFQLTVNNTDSVACGASNFDLSVVDAQGFVVSFSANSVSVNPGESANASLTLTSPGGAALGEHSFTVEAKQAGTSQVATTNLIYEVQQGVCVNNPATLVLAPNSFDYTPTQGQPQFTLTVTNNDTGSCGDSTFSTVASGATELTFNPVPDLTIAPGGQQQVVVTMSVAQGTAPSALKFTLESTSSAGQKASVDGEVAVGHPPCARANPTVVVVPAAGSEVTQAGDTLVLDVTVTNQDSISCGPSAFDLGTDLGSAWTVTGASIAALAPMAQSTVQITVVSAEDAAAGDHAFNVTATNQSAPAYKTSTAANYSIPAGCQRQVPSLLITDKGGNLFEVAANNADSAACGKSKFFVLIQDQDGNTMYETEIELDAAEVYRYAYQLTQVGVTSLKVIVTHGSKPALQVSKSVDVSEPIDAPIEDPVDDPEDPKSSGCAVASEPPVGMFALLLLGLVLRRRRD